MMIKRHIISTGLCVALMNLPMAALAQEKIVHLDISGMTCAVCPITIRHYVLNMKGVHDASIDLKTATALVSYDDQKQSSQKISQSITKLGYPTTISKGE
ncbi:MAG: cation transporter [Zetaproteobacteria bacterium]|nr:cation transporter [Zetaproteobacteria bacterium]